MMPGETGVELTKSLRDEKDVPILMLTALSETDSRIAGLEAGADDYLPKPFDPRELILRINNILRRGGPPTTPKVEQIVFGPYTFQIARRELKRGGEPLKLTDREQEILAIFAARAGETIPRHELVARRVRGRRAHDRRADQPAAPQDRARPVQSGLAADRARHRLPAERGIERTVPSSIASPSDTASGWRPRELDRRQAGRAAHRRRAGEARCAAAGARSGALSRYMPKRLYARSLLIIITPMILLQSVVAFVFMERHWQTVTQRLSPAVTRDIAAIIDMIETYPHDDDYANVIRIAQERLALKIDILPPDPLPAARPEAVLLDPRPDPVRRRSRDQINRPFWIDTVGNSNIVEIRIQLEDKVLRVFARRSQAYASNTHIFLLWMVGTSLVLLDHRHPLPAQPDPADPAARRGRRKLRQGPADAARLPPARRRRGAPRRLRLHPDARAHRAPDRAAHGDADRRQPRPAHHPDPLQAAAGAGRLEAGPRGARTRTSTTCSRCWKAISPSPAARRRRTPGASTSSDYLRQARRGGQAAQAQADDHARRRARRCMCGRTPSRGCCPTSSATRSAMPRTSRSSADHTARLADRHRRRRRPGHSRREAARTCSSRSSGSTRRATSMPAAPGSACPSPATSPAAMAATSRWTTARSAACGRSSACRPERNCNSRGI